MKNITSISKLCFIIFIFTLNSCQDENLEITQKNIIAEKTANGDKENLLNNGWKIVKTISLDSSIQSTNLYSKASKLESVPKIFELTAKHLKDLGYDISQSNDRSRLKKAFIRNGIIPDGIKFSPTLSIDGHPLNNAGPEPSARIAMYPAILSNEKTETPPDDVYSTSVVNPGNYPGTLSVKYSYKEGFRTSWSRTVRGSLTMGVKAGIKIKALASLETYAEVMVGGEETSGEDKTTEITKESTYTMTVPARSKINIKIYTKKESSKVEYTIPYVLFGPIRTNYPTTVNGHYFWSENLFYQSAFNIVNEQGIARGTKYREVQIIVSPAESI